MKKLIALILISLLIPIPSASADNDIPSTFVKIVSGNDIELAPAWQKYSGWDSRADYTKVSLGVSICRSGNIGWMAICGVDARKATFSIVDNDGRKVTIFDQRFSSYGHGLDLLLVKNINLDILPSVKLVLPLKLKAEFEFVHTSPITLQTFYYPLNVKLNKVDTAEADAKAKAEADRLAAEKAIADAKAKAEAEAKAKVEAELKAKQEAEAKAKADAEAKAKAEADKKAEYDKFLAEQKAKVEAETKAKYEAVTWTCRADLNQYYFDTYNKTVPLMNGADSDIFCKNLWAEVTKKELVQKEAELKAMQAKRDLVNGTACKKLGSTKIAGGATFTCKKINKKLIWKM